MNTKPEKYVLFSCPNFNARKVKTTESNKILLENDFYGWKMRFKLC